MSKKPVLKGASKSAATVPTPVAATVETPPKFDWPLDADESTVGTSPASPFRPTPTLTPPTEAPAPVVLDPAVADDPAFAATINEADLVAAVEKGADELPGNKVDSSAPKQVIVFGLTENPPLAALNAASQSSYRERLDREEQAGQRALQRMFDKRRGMIRRS